MNKKKRRRSSSVNTKLRDVDEKLDFVKDTFAKILLKQKISLTNNESFNLQEYGENLNSQYQSLKSLQEKLLVMLKKEKSRADEQSRIKLLTIIKKNYYLQKNLGLFIHKNKLIKQPMPLAPVTSTTPNQIIKLSPDLIVKELFLDEEDEMPIRLSNEYIVIEELMDEIEQTQMVMQQTIDQHDLTQIEGITKQLEAVLKAGGINTLEKIAELSPEEVKKMDSRIIFRGKIKKQDWIGQAKQLLIQ